ncbi:DUF7793 family protein [Brumimicrobium oceani]|uniref:DUF7793 domain-containing protein n=1 Tax=Brumimicrobium oceani TaxID=2100725 RepID=A0A2U2XA28_9FLAO|nr:hypothetical protein [Brumimicrobium oceani]PWH84649.1 hypothetical protein DIT68_13060 [Brumimicrobium oceani]
MKVIVKKSLGYADVTIYDNDIFHTHVLSAKPLTLEQAKEITNFRMTNMKGRKALMLSTGEDRYIIPTQEALDYIQSTNRAATVKGDAFVIKSLSQRLFIKTVNNLRKMQTPVSFFASNQKAIDWLLRIKS